MPRRAPSASESSTTVIDRPVPAPVELRPGAEIRPDIVNVFEEGVSPGAASGLRLAPLGGRKAGDAIALSVRAWVRNLSYDKDLWIDLSLAGEGGELLHAESLSLSFLEPAGGEGDFFTIGTAVPAPTPEEGPAPTLLYRLYGQMHGQLFTDGVLHRHSVAREITESGPAPKAGTPTASTGAATKPAATSSTKPAATSSTKPAASSSTKPAASSTSKPASSTSKPVATSSSKPSAPSSTATPSATPATSSSKPVATSSSKPVATSSSKPAAPSTKPATSSGKPAVEPSKAAKTTTTTQATRGTAKTTTTAKPATPTKTSTATSGAATAAEKAAPKGVEKPAGKAPATRKRTASKD